METADDSRPGLVPATYWSYQLAVGPTHRVKSPQSGVQKVNYVLRRLMMPGKLRKLFVERLTEPIHLNLLSLFVALFGSYRAKVDFDLIVRQQYAFPILFAA